MKRCLILALACLTLTLALLGCGLSKGGQETAAQEFSLPSLSLDLPMTAVPMEPELNDVSGIAAGMLTVGEYVAEDGRRQRETGRTADYPLEESKEPIVFSGELQTPLSFRMEITGGGELKIILLDGAVTAGTSGRRLQRGGETEFILRSGKEQLVLLECPEGTGVYLFTRSN